MLSDLIGILSGDLKSILPIIIYIIGFIAFSWMGLLLVSIGINAIDLIVFIFIALFSKKAP